LPGPAHPQIVATSRGIGKEGVTTDGALTVDERETGDCARGMATFIRPSLLANSCARSVGPGAMMIKPTRLGKAMLQ
jgi:hypothetical protein